MAYLGAFYRTYALDFWGFGESGTKRSTYAVKDFVSLVYQFMEQLGIVRAPLVGHSMGGLIALATLALIIFIAYLARFLSIQLRPVLSGFMQAFVQNLGMASFLDIGAAADFYDDFRFGVKPAELTQLPRPLWLLPTPMPVSLAGESVRSRDGEGGAVTLLTGPERIESGWWEGAWVARDYFIARAADGALLWVYRPRAPD